MASSADQIIAEGAVEKVEAMQAEIARLEEIIADRFEVKLHMALEIKKLRAALEEFADAEHHQPPVPLWISIKARKVLDNEEGK